MSGSSWQTFWWFCRFFGDVLDRAHCSLRPKPHQGQYSRPVIVRFHHYIEKEVVLNWARTTKEILYMGHWVKFYEEFCALVAKKRASFNNVKGLLYKRGVRFGMIYPARRRVTHRLGALFWFFWGCRTVLRSKLSWITYWIMTDRSFQRLFIYFFPPGVSLSLKARVFFIYLKDFLLLLIYFFNIIAFLFLARLTAIIVILHFSQLEPTPLHNRLR